MKTSITNNKTWKRKLWAGCFWIFLWAILSGIVQREVYLPSPLSTVNRLIQIASESKSWLILGSSWIRVWGGFFLSFFAGILLGFPAGLFPRIKEWLEPAIQTIKSTPVIALILLVFIWVPSNLVPLVISFLIGFPVIWAQTTEGVMRTDPKLLEMTQVFRLSPVDRLRKIYFPSAWPAIRSASQTAVGLCWKSSVAAEVLSHPRLAIGSKLYDAKVYLETPDLFAWTLILILASIITEKAFISIFRQRRDLHGDH
jgi:NitT/TauT family transport system permease protein